MMHELNGEYVLHCDADGPLIDSDQRAVNLIDDITEHLAASDALRDWVRESNWGSELCFLPSFEDIAARLSKSTPFSPGSTPR